MPIANRRNTKKIHADSGGKNTAKWDNRNAILSRKGTIISGLIDEETTRSTKERAQYTHCRQLDGAIQRRIMRGV